MKVQKADGIDHKRCNTCLFLRPHRLYVYPVQDKHTTVLFTTNKKINMKKVLALIFLIWFGMQVAHAQGNNDIIHLKNGIIVVGYIFEEMPGKQIKIKTVDGEERVYQYDEIEKIVKQYNNTDLTSYGGTTSFGIALGGGGVIGIPLRYYFTPMMAFEVGAFYRPIITNPGFGNPQVDNGILLTGGPVFYLGKYYKAHKDKVKLNGVSLRAGIGIANIREALFAVSWVNEGFRKNRTGKSFIFELGLGATTILDAPNFISYSNNLRTQPIIYFKCHWSFYGRKRG